MQFKRLFLYIIKSDFNENWTNINSGILCKIFITSLSFFITYYDKKPITIY